LAATFGLAAIAHHLRTRLVPHPQRRHVV